AFVVTVVGEVAGQMPCFCEMDGAPESVDVFDLLAYLALWFAAGPGAESWGDSPANVGVFDLLAYLDCWFAASAGNCPPAPPLPDPTGACCLGGSCSVMTEAACGDGGGVYLGDESICEAESCSLDGGVFIS